MTARRKVRLEAVPGIQERRRRGEKIAAIAADLGVSESLISRICAGITPAVDADLGARVLNAAAAHFEVSPDTLASCPRRGRPDAGDLAPRARKAAALALRQHAQWSYPAIQSVIGPCDVRLLFQRACSDEDVRAASAAIAVAAGLGGRVS